MNKEESLALYKEGRKAWNAWAEEMLAQRTKLEETGDWMAEVLEETGRLQGKNAATQDWLAVARSDFSALNFENEVDFSDFVFPEDAEFAEAKFAHKAQFRNTRFSGNAWFNDATFGDETEFRKATFGGYAWFGNAKFSGRTDFWEATFGIIAWFGNAKFIGSQAIFRETTFSGPAWFGEVTFGGGVGFGKAKFSDQADFKKSTFSGDVWFGEATFGGIAWFWEATFSGAAAFWGATFGGYADFKKTTFSGEANFERATFSRGAWFNDVPFSGEARFGEATFSTQVEFREVTFGGYADFKKATFSGADFTKATFNGKAEFNETSFKRDALFCRTRFMSDARFDKARFIVEPGFDGMAGFNLALFESNTSFFGAVFEYPSNFVALKGKSYFSLKNVRFLSVPDFEQANFAEAPRLDHSYVQALGKEPDVAARWRALRRLATQGHDYERELIFLAEEIKSLRGDQDQLVPNPLNFLKDKKVWPGGGRYWAGLLYQWFSDFGRSTARPLLWWVIITAIFTFCFHYLSPHSDLNSNDPLSIASCSGSDPVTAALYLSVNNGLVISGLGRSEKLMQSYACLYGKNELGPIMPDAVVFSGIAQTVLSAVLIFLFLLALRNYFRIR